MALVGNDLGDAMLAALRGAVAATPTAGPDQQTAIWRAIGAAMVTYITANAQVTSTVTVTSVAGVTIGPGVSGPGAGTATGTVS